MAYFRDREGRESVTLGLALWAREGILPDYSRELQGGVGRESEVVAEFWHSQLHWVGRGVTVDLQGDSRDGVCGGAPLLCTYGWIMTHIPQMLVLSQRQPFHFSAPLPELSSRNIHLCALRIKTNPHSCCRLFRKALMLKSQSSVVGLIFSFLTWASWAPCMLLVLCFMH